MPGGDLERGTRTSGPASRVTADMSRLTIGEVTEPGRNNFYRRPDGSLTHW
jgi:hypothetical protein